MRSYEQKCDVMTQFWLVKKGIYPHKFISHVSPLPGGVDDVVALSGRVVVGVVGR